MERILRRTGRFALRFALILGLSGLCACTGGRARDQSALGPGLDWLGLIAASAPHSPPPRLVTPPERSKLEWPGGDKERRLTSIRLLLRADLDLDHRDWASAWDLLQDEVLREIEKSGAKLQGSGGTGPESEWIYSRDDAKGLIVLWHVQGQRALHLAVWADEER